MVTIISTLPTKVRYNLWKEDSQMHSKVRLWDCIINGGSGVIDRRTLITPQGVATEVTDEAYEKLLMIPDFVNDVKKGFLKVLKGVKARAVDADEEAEKDMNLDSAGKQITSEDLEADGAVINDDGSVDVSKGGKNAKYRKDLEAKERSISIDIPNAPAKRGRGRGKKA